MRYTLQSAAGKTVHTGDSMPEVGGRPPEVVFHGPRTYVLRDRAELIYGEASAWFVPLAEGTPSAPPPSTPIARAPAVRPAPAKPITTGGRSSFVPGRAITTGDLFAMSRPEKAK